MIKLHPMQQLHYPTIRYLLNDARGQGKSFLIAYAYLMEAVEHIGRKYSPVDFPNSTIHSQRNMLDVVKMIADDLGIKIKIYKTSMEFAVEFANPHIDIKYQIEGYE